MGPNFNHGNNYNINQQRRPIKCCICNGNHFANQCINKRNFTNNNQIPNQNNQKNCMRYISCEYCNNNGHNINECYKKMFNDSQNNINPNDNANSGNENESGAVCGTRTINHIMTAEQSETASMLYQ